MKKLLIMLCLVSCTSNGYKYKIEGVVETKDGGHPEIWYTDTISFDGDTAYYFNGNGGEVRISPPYVVKTIK